MKIKRITWIAKEFSVSDDFASEVNKAIIEFQELGYKVEVQYQQSDNVVSAFIIGRGE